MLICVVPVLSLCIFITVSGKSCICSMCVTKIILLKFSFIASKYGFNLLIFDTCKEEKPSSMIRVSVFCNDVNFINPTLIAIERNNFSAPDANSIGKYFDPYLLLYCISRSTDLLFLFFVVN